MRNDRRKQQQQGRWMSNEEYDQLLGQAQKALSELILARRILAEADDQVAKATSIMRESRNRLKENE